MKATTLGRSGRCGRRSGSACGGVMRPTALQQQRLVGKSNGESVPSALAQQLRRQHPRWRGGRRLLALAVAAERAGAKATGAGAGAGAGADATQAHLDRGLHDRGLHRGRHRHHRLRGCSACAPCGGFFVVDLHSRLRGGQQTSIFAGSERRGGRIKSVPSFLQCTAGADRAAISRTRGCGVCLHKGRVQHWNEQQQGHQAMISSSSPTA